MKLKELFDNTGAGKGFLPKISVNMDDVDQNDRYEIAGMLRGLKVAIEGFKSISGLTNDLFDDDGSVVLTFESIDNARYFKECVDYYFDDAILAALKVKRRVRRSK
jgi:hypothetical protein